MKLTCGSFLFDLLQFGEGGQGHHLQIHTFPNLKELHQTVNCELQDKPQETHFSLKRHVLDISHVTLWLPRHRQFRQAAS